MKIMFGWFNNLRIRTKLITAFAMILSFLATVSAVSLWSSTSVTRTTNQLFEDDIRTAELVDEIQMTAYRMQTAEKDYFLRYKELGFEQARDTLVAFVESQAELIDEILEEVRQLMTDEAELALVRQVAEHNTDFHLYFLETVEQMEERGMEGSGLEGAFRSKVHDIEEALESLNNDRLTVDMLMIRRNEKDYMLRGDQAYVEDVRIAVDTLKTDVANAGLDSDTVLLLQDIADSYFRSFSEMARMDLRIAENTEFYRQAINDMTLPLEEILELAMNKQDSGLDNLHETLANSTMLVAAISGIAIVLSLLVAFVLASIISRPIAAITAAVRNMAGGSLDEKLNIDSRDEIGQLSKSMLEMQDRLKTIIQSEINGIIRKAGEGNLSDRIGEQDKQGFYRDLAESINELIAVNEQFLNQTAAVVSDLADGRLDSETGKRFGGKFGEVQNDIQRMRENFIQVISRDVQRIVSAASQGDLDHKIELQGKAGFYLDLSEGINTLVETNAAVINDCMRVIGALSSGSFDERFTRKYEGSFARLQEYVERMHGNLRQAIERDIQSIVSSAANGDLKERIELDRKEGFYLTLSSSINELVETCDDIISDASRVIGAMARGDLTETVDREYKGTFDALKQNINKTVQELISTVENIQRAASSVDTGADEISSGNTNLSQRTEEQAASLEETSAAMEEMTTTVQLTAENSAKATQLSRESISTAERGGEVVDQAIKSMDMIQQSSTQIAEIVGVIDEIAFQTNLLALNASVEAARAGEQGKGFAVVADEVRVLAQRCAKAAKEIKELITNSTENVRTGSELANKSGEALQDIIVAARKVNSIIGEISASCDEQSTGIREINTSLTQMDSMTQQNAALVEEAAAASESLSDQARELNQLVSVFRISRDAAATADVTEAEVISFSSRRKAG